MPKARPKGVADGRRVNIPVPAAGVFTDGVSGGLATRPDGWRVQASRGACRQTRRPRTPRRDGERASPAKFAMPYRLEKPLGIRPATVPRPTQVEGCQYTKARERNLVKELGNIAP